MSGSAKAKRVPAEDATPAVRLTLSLLGPPTVLIHGEPASGLGSQKVLALLAYLAVGASRQHLRGEVTALLWPEQPATRAYQNLRKTLSRLRGAIGDDDADPPHLLSDSVTLQFNPHSDYWFDVDVFESLLHTAQHHRHRRLLACPICLSALRQAAELYQGEFLAGLSLPDALGFGEWLLLQRESLRQQVSSAFHALARAYLARGKPGTARQYARKLLQLDPWNEPGHRLLMRSLTLSEGRNAALHHFGAFRNALAAELGVEPEDETLALLGIIRAGELPDPHASSPATLLPLPATPVVGREAERRRVTEQLASPDQRLITISGPGGSGKTRLAMEIAREQVSLWRDGVWFTPLDEVQDPRRLVDALAAALALVPAHSPLAVGDLVDFLRTKELLLILDGFEQLIDGSPLLQDILRWAPDVKMLVTSRARLVLQGEWALQLGGLEVPSRVPATSAEAMSYSAVKLLLQNARRVNPEFSLSQENLRHAVRICRLVEGMPLGIQLAAAWVQMFPCRQIAEEIARSPDFLHNPDGSTPERQHSLRATFDYSYNLLSARDQDIMRKLSVFRGGFTPEEAQRVAGATPLDLASLLDKSLLRNGSPGRLQLHQPLRHYAAEQLAALPREEETAREQHAGLYLGFVQEREAKLDGECTKSPLEEIASALANVRAAWHWAVIEGRMDLLAATIPGLSRFYALRGLLREAVDVFSDAADCLSPFEDEDPALLGRLLAEQARFQVKRSMYGSGIQAARKAITLAQAGQDVLTQAVARRWWGQALFRQGDYQAAQAQLDQAVSLAQAVQARGVEADSLGILGGLRWGQGDYAGVTPYLERALHIYRETGDRKRQAGMLSNLGIVAVEQGAYSEARIRYQEALSVMHEVDDRHGVGVVLGNLGNIYLYVGDYAKAQRHYEQALGELGDTDDRTCEANTLGNLGLVHHALGDDETAMAYGQEALRIAREAGQRPLQAFRLLGLGDACLELGRLAQAADAYGQALSLRQELDQPNLATEPRAGLARVALAQADVSRAQAEIEPILRYLQANAPPPGSAHPLDGTASPAQVYLTCYRVLAANQDPRAPEVLAAAYALVQGRAAKIKDPAIRRSFLESVTIHRQIVDHHHRLDAAPAPTADDVDR